MSCRNAAVSSGITSFGRLLHGLADGQDGSLFHELRRECPPGYKMPSEWSRREWLKSMTKVVNESSLSPARRASIVARFTEAGTEHANSNVERDRWYAAERFMETCGEAKTALDAEIWNVSRLSGTHLGTIQRAYETLLEDATKDRSLKPGDGFTKPPNVPGDRKTLWVLQQLQKKYPPTVAGVKRAVNHQQAKSLKIAQMGWSAENERLEMEFKARPGRVYAYKVPESVWNDLNTAIDPWDVYSGTIRGNKDFFYTDQEVYRSEEFLSRCGACGQFASSSHVCPEKTPTTLVALTTETFPEGVTVLPFAQRARGFSKTAEATRSGSIVEAVTVLNAQRTVGVPVVAKFNNGTVTVTGVIVASKTGGTVTTRGYVNDVTGNRYECSCDGYVENKTCFHSREILANFAAKLAVTARLVKTPTTPAEDVPLLVPPAVGVSRKWDETAYSVRFDTFMRDITETLTHPGVNIPFMKGNATNGLGSRETGRPFGVEIEFDFPETTAPLWRVTQLRKIGKELHDLQLTTKNTQQPADVQIDGVYQKTAVGGWTFKKDSSVAGEITSPILWDEPETWVALETVCAVVKKHGGVVSHRTGSHIHVGCPDLIPSGASARLRNMVREQEDVLFRLASTPGSGKRRGVSYCRPTSTAPVAGTGFVDVLAGQDFDRNVAVNFQQVTGSQSDHVEFRLWDGSLNPGVIQTQMKLSLALTNSAVVDKTWRPNPACSVPLGARHAAVVNGTLVDAKDQTYGARVLFDRLFSDAEDRRQAAALFAVTAWQPSSV
jgi:hypothetical protein